MLFSRPVMFNSLRPHGLQLPRPPCPSPFPGVCPSSYSLHWWCYPAHLILWHPLLLLPSIFPSFRDFSMSHLFTSDGNFSFSFTPSSECPGLISLKIDWFDLLAVQGTFRSFLQHHSLKASILWHSTFFMAQLSQLYTEQLLMTKTESNRKYLLHLNI